MNEEVWREFDNLAAIVHRQALRIEELERRVEALSHRLEAGVVTERPLLRVVETAEVTA